MSQRRSVAYTESVRLDGPRVGITVAVSPELREKMEDHNIQPFITQFGWQVETQFFSLPSGVSGLVEGVVLIGGIEQNTFLPSGTFLIGLRNAQGLEFGFGPNFSATGAAFALAAGITFQTEYVNFPVNLAFVPSTAGSRVSLLVGFNARRKRF